MKSFINKIMNKPIVLNFYTARQTLFTHSSPIKPAKVFPAWWKALPKIIRDPQELGDRSTMKKCTGFIELYQKGIIIPMWSDVEIEVNSIGNNGVRWQHADIHAELHIHSQRQRGEYLLDTHYQHIKLESPWYAQCDEDVKWMFVQPTWNFDNPERIIIPTGIVEFKHQHGTHVNMFIPREDKPSKVFIPQGQPMAHIVPLTERPVEYRVHLVSKEELNAMKMESLWFVDIAAKQKRGAGECPFKGRGGKV